MKSPLNSVTSRIVCVLHGRVVARQVTLGWMKCNHILTSLSMVTTLVAPTKFVGLCNLPNIRYPAFSTATTGRPYIRW